MGQEAKQLRAFIASWEKKRRHAEKTIAKARALLELLDSEPGVVRGRERKAPRVVSEPELPLMAEPTPFSPKYGKSAKTYMLEVLERKPLMTMREVRQALEERGLKYSEQALALSMRSLMGSGRVRRHHAPRGIGSQYVFELLPESQEETS